MNYLQLKHLLLLGLLLILPSCEKKEPKSSSEEREETELPTNRIAIPASVRSNLGITFARVERRNVSSTFRVPGYFELQPLAKQEYRMMLPGHIEFLVQQFDEVEKGTPLYRFRSLELLDLQQRVDLAKAKLSQAQSKLGIARERKKALAKANFKRADLDVKISELQADADLRQAELKAATMALQGAVQSKNEMKKQAGDWIEVRAKQSGIVESFAVTNGTYVEETTLILTMVDPTQIRFHAMGLQSDLLKFKTGQ
ncbi:MAG: efflux RND transporter periplasmic adaptor subunit, partial [Akkermansiaceae bacterium]